MKFIKILLIFLVINSCKNNDVADIDIKVLRFDRELFTIDSSNFEDKWNSWKDNLEDLPKYYFNHHLNIVFSSDSLKRINVLQFVSHPDVLEYQDSIDSHFLDIDKISYSLNKVFGRYNNCFPDSILPERIVIINSFNSYGIDVYNKNLLIGLDVYLGENHPEFSIMWNYLKERSNKKFIVPDALEFWITSTFLECNIEENFLDELIYKGKVIYLMSQIMPDFPEENILRFSKEELMWCEQNEYNIWNEIIRLDLMYESDWNRFHTFFVSSPFTKGMPKESPGRIGYWVGYMIIQIYMENNEVSLLGLMQNTNSQEILLHSKYNP